MSLLESLKKETYEEHNHIESNLDLLSSHLSIEQYLSILKAFYGLYLSYEETVYSSEISSSYRPFKRVPLLVNDLMFFGLSLEEISSLPTYSFSYIRSAEELVGTMYVIEGSSLGGQVLYNHFSRKFSFDHINGLSFFFGQGAETFHQWKNFKAAIENDYERANWNKEVVISSAKKTFNNLNIWLSQ